MIYNQTHTIEYNYSETGKLVLGGKFRVFPDSTIYRVRVDGTEVEANVTVLTIPRKSKDGKYLTVTRYDEDGKQRNYYVGRLLAEAFKENPTGSERIKYIDGDGLNVSLDNIRWETPQDVQERVMKSAQIRELYKEKCTDCSCLAYVNDKGMCSDCRVKDRLVKQSLENQQKKMRELKERLGCMDLNLLTEKQRTVVEMRLKGMILGDIAKEMGCSRQNVDILIRSAEKRHKRLTTLEP